MLLIDSQKRCWFVETFSLEDEDDYEHEIWLFESFFFFSGVLKNKHSRRKASVYFLIPKVNTFFFLPSPDRKMIKLLTFDILRHFPP